LFATRTLLLALRKFTPSNPQIEVYQTRASGLEQEIRDASSQVAGARTSLAGNAVEYQRLLLESQFADKQLASALTSLEEARNEARRKQVYIERIAQPSEPDRALEPQRVRGMVSTLALGLVAWGIASLLLAGVREHTV
jgi:capsular polysaccharide transport system permease protein